MADVLTWFREDCVKTLCPYFQGILPKGPYLPCVSMVGRALLAGCHRFVSHGRSKNMNVGMLKGINNTDKNSSKYPSLRHYKPSFRTTPSSGCKLISVRQQSVSWSGLHLVWSIISRYCIEQRQNIYSILLTHYRQSISCGWAIVRIWGELWWNHNVSYTMHQYWLTLFFFCLSFWGNYFQIV